MARRQYPLSTSACHLLGSRFAHRLLELSSVLSPSPSSPTVPAGGQPPRASEGRGNPGVHAMPADSGPRCNAWNQAAMDPQGGVGASCQREQKQRHRAATETTLMSGEASQAHLRVGGKFEKAMSWEGGKRNLAAAAERPPDSGCGGRARHQRQWAFLRRRRRSCRPRPWRRGGSRLGKGRRGGPPSDPIRKTASWSGVNDGATSGCSGHVA